MNYELLSYLVILFPLLSFVINGVIIRNFFDSASIYAGYTTIFSILISFIISIIILVKIISSSEQFLFEPINWISISHLYISFGILLDNLTIVMMVVITSVSLLVQIYGLSYMHSDKSITRYYTFMSLFTASMLGLVLSKNIVQLFVFWELVGVSSYLLIGFWMNRPSAANAAKKAFIMTRFGDFGFLFGILYLFSINPSYLDINTLYNAISNGEISTYSATVVSAGLLIGAIGKSAQFPLHTWLPDAMEGPTSVSALIHSATMVTAGVFLIARFFPLFDLSNVMIFLALLGGITSVFAASMGLVADDIKKVLAYSTISQLGYMMFALGIGAYAPAIFHLFTHAFFKACLFLGAGSIHHASGTFNMKFMGGMRKIMPVTYIAMIISSLSLAGIFPLSGFWSKDEILAHAAHQENFLGYIVLFLGLIAAFLTAFYMFRVIFLVFHGEWKGGGEAEKKELLENNQEIHPTIVKSHLEESPNFMIYPMIILGGLAIIVGFIVNPLIDLFIVEKHAFAHFITDNYHVFQGDKEKIYKAGGSPKFDVVIALLSSLIAIGAIWLAYVIYIKQNNLSFQKYLSKGIIYRVLKNKYYLDYLYEDIIIRKLFYKNLSVFLRWIDENIDNINVQITNIVSRLSRSILFLQNGQTQVYVYGMFIGILSLLIIFYLSGGLL
ncbi:MAG: NADH-quinone oxidoreductase subunit L [Chloroflexi bacterium]|nr:NADH-quinone oxidoreductase subunit L [Chloroflexota bacterium]